MTEEELREIEAGNYSENGVYRLADAFRRLRMPDEVRETIWSALASVPAECSLSEHECELCARAKAAVAWLSDIEPTVPEYGPTLAESRLAEANAEIAKWREEFDNAFGHATLAAAARDEALKERDQARAERDDAIKCFDAANESRGRARDDLAQANGLIVEYAESDDAAGRVHYHALGLSDEARQATERAAKARRELRDYGSALRKGASDV